MIIYFKVANYKSIKEPLVINFNAATISEHVTSNVFQQGKLSLLKSIVLYGHNASGKSKILDAIVFFKWFINNSATQNQSNADIGVEPFEFNERCAEMPSFFEMAFVIDHIKYRYGFETDKKAVHKEWLLEAKANKENHVFLRIDQDLEIDFKRFPNSEELEKRTRKNALFLSVAAQWNVEKAQIIDAWIKSIFTIHGMEDDMYRDATIKLLKSTKYKALVNKFINNADLGINGIDIVDMPVKMEELLKGVPEELIPFFSKRLKQKSSNAIFTLHNKYNDNCEIVGTVPLLMDQSESEGTKKYFNIIGVLIMALLENKIVVIDEFDARLHTLLTKAILKLFNSSVIQSRAQLLIASHDTALLDRDILRRDEIYFIEKDKYGSSSAVSLVEYKPRKESPYDKNYLEGKYGAIPFIDDMEVLFNNA